MELAYKLSFDEHGHKELEEEQYLTSYIIVEEIGFQNQVIQLCQVDKCNLIILMDLFIYIALE